MIYIKTSGQGALITWKTPADHNALMAVLSRHMIQYDYSRKLRTGGFKEKARFFAYREKKKEVYVVIGSLPNIIKHLENKRVEVKVTISKGFKPHKCNISFRGTNLKPRGYQIEALEFLNKDNNRLTTVIGLQTGMGKTITAMIEMVRRKRKVFVMMPSFYVQQWIKEIQEHLDVELGKDLVMFKGAASMTKEFTLVKKGLSDAKIYIVGYSTLRNYINAWINGKKLLLIQPPVLLKKLGCDYVIKDEAHKELHFSYIADAVLGPKETILLSGTYKDNDMFVRERLQDLCPAERRFILYREANHIMYVDSGYHFGNPNLIRTSYPGVSTYSHIAYEQSILRHNTLLNNYLLMIKTMVDKYYMANRTEGDKVAVYVSSVEMVNKIRDFLKQSYPDLRVTQFIGGDHQDTIYDNDVINTTVGKSGTGTDMPDLITVVSSVNIGGANTIEQLFGRLRVLKGKTCTFVQLWNKQIDVHKKYRLNNKDAIGKLWKDVIKDDYMPLL